MTAQPQAWFLRSVQDRDTHNRQASISTSASLFRPSPPRSLEDPRSGYLI